MKACLKKALTAIGIIKALVSRTLFAAHGFVCIWRVVVVKENPLFWCLTASLPLLVFEAIFTVKKKKGGEWKWVCPSVFLYLAIAVPAIWFLELDLLDKRLHGHHRNRIGTHTRKVHGTVLPGQIEIPIFLRPDDWCKILEQMLLLILIMGRWLLPKGEITREQLSQLLLVYIGMAADIIELFEAFKEKQVKNNRILTLVIMSLWTASLLQFTFVLTATKSKTTRPVLVRSRSSASSRSSGKRRCCPTEAISIIVSVLLQDGPFLVLRMMLIFRFRVLSYTNLFFTLKNSLVITLQFYRLLILFCRKPDRAAQVTRVDSDKRPSLSSDTKSSGSRLVLDNGNTGITSVNFIKDGSLGRRSSLLRRQQSVCSTSYQSQNVEHKNRRRSFSDSSTSPEHTDIDEESYIIQKALDNCILKLKNTNKYIEPGAVVTEVDDISRNCGLSKDISRKHGGYYDAGSESVEILNAAIKYKMAAIENKEAKSAKEDRIGKGKGKSKGKKKKVKGKEVQGKKAEDHWDDVRKLASAIAFINETEKYRSFLLHEQKQNGGLYEFDDDKPGCKPVLEDSGG